VLLHVADRPEQRNWIECSKMLSQALLDRLMYRIGAQEPLVRSEWWMVTFTNLRGVALLARQLE
jgi:hypothetical protein